MGTEQMEANVGRFDTAVRCDLSVLATLAHINWLNTQQLQALCFPGYSLGTVRTRLRHLQKARWIEAVRWRVGEPQGGQFWTISRQGTVIARRYFMLPATVSEVEVVRPSTALEQQEWCAQAMLRTLIVRLILEARERALLSHLALDLRCEYIRPAMHNVSTKPDTEINIVWEPATMKGADWLPWLMSSQPPDHATRYAIYIDRPAAATPFLWIAEERPLEVAERSIAIFVLHSDERHAAFQQRLQGLPVSRPIRTSSLSTLTTGISSRVWLNEHGGLCSLQP